MKAFCVCIRAVYYYRYEIESAGSWVATKVISSVSIGMNTFEDIVKPTFTSRLKLLRDVLVLWYNLLFIEKLMKYVPSCRFS